MSFKVQYAATCNACFGTIKKGEIGRYERDRLVHDECPDPTKARTPLCPTCFTELPVTGECGTC